MAVHTPVGEEEARAFLAGFPRERVGRLLSFEGIAEGVENTNFRVDCEGGGAFVLTLFERRVRESDIPFFLAFAEHLAERGAPAPRALARADGARVARLAGRPAALFERLPGRAARAADVSPALCREAGALLARMHAAAADFPLGRENDLGAARWPALLEEARGAFDGAPCGGAFDSADSPGAPSGDRAPGASEGLPLESPPAGGAMEGALERAGRALEAVRARAPGPLPEAVVHADLFPDNLLVEGGRAAGVVDFCFACTERLEYDLAVLALSWCRDARGRLRAPLLRALLSGYEGVRPRSPEERAAHDALCAGAALRFFCTRAIDLFTTPGASRVERKDPLPMLRAAEEALGLEPPPKSGRPPGGGPSKAPAQPVEGRAAGAAGSFTAHTDGSCLGNPGPGGWAAVLDGPGGRRVISGAEPATTSSRMELEAAARALEALPPGARVEVRTDSQYLSRGWNEWLPRWRRTGWRGSRGKQVANQDLWRRLEAAAEGRSVSWTWVRGHDGDEGNEAADAAAHAAATRGR